MSIEQLVKSMNRLNQKVDRLTQMIQNYIRYNSNNDLTQQDFYNPQNFTKQELEHLEQLEQNPLQNIENLIDLLDQEYNSYNPQ